jgi:hypothetical protein
MGFVRNLMEAFMASSDTHSSDTSSASSVAISGTDSVITESEPAGAAQCSLTLKQAAARIIQLAHAETSATLQNAFNAAALKKRIIDGEAGEGVKWMEWMEWMIKHVRMSKSQLYALVHIGEADEPAKALDEWRRAANQRSKNRGKKKKEPLSEEHERMISFILAMPPDVVKTEHLNLYQRYPQYR